jgi:hypothetical protein
MTHNLVITLISKGFAITFGAYVFMVSLNMHNCKSKRLASKGFATYSNEGFTLYCFTIMFFYDSHMQKERKINIKLHPNYGYTMPIAFTNSKSTKHESNSMMNMLATVEHSFLTYMMDVSKMALHTSCLTPLINELKM